MHGRTILPTRRTRRGQPPSGARRHAPTARWPQPRALPPLAARRRLAGGLPFCRRDDESASAVVGRHAAPTTLHGAARALTDARRVLPWQAMKPSGPVPARMPVTAGVAPSLRRRRRRRRRGPSRLRRNGPRARRTRATSGDGGRSSGGPRAATTTAPSSSATRSSCTARPVSRTSTQPTATPRACKCCTTTLRPSRRAWTATSARSMRRPSCVGDTVHKVGCRDSGRLCDPVPCARVARAASTRRPGVQARAGGAVNGHGALAWPEGGDARRGWRGGQ